MQWPLQFAARCVRKRVGWPLLAALTLTAALGLPSSAAGAPRVPPQGLYDTCAPADSPDGCLFRLRVIAFAGFKVVQPMNAFRGADRPDILGFADAAHAHGLKVIWTLNSGPDRANLLGLMPEVAAECGCETEDEMLAYVIGLVKGHPATWGYYLSDEPSPDQRDQVAAYAEQVKALDPNHPGLIMGCGLCWGGEKSVEFLADIDATLGTDAYPVHAQAPDQPAVFHRVAEDAAGLQRVADRRGRRTVMALQAWRWGDSHYDSESTGIGADSRFPTQREIKMQRNAAITNARLDLILWFTLNQVIGWEPGQRPWYWADPPNPRERWATLVRGAFAPLHSEGVAMPRDQVEQPREGAEAHRANRRPLARFVLRVRRKQRRSRTLRVVVNASRSRDRDGRIVRYRWYALGKEPRQLACRKRRCAVRLRRTRRQRIRLVVTDDSGARASRVRSLKRRD
jgi:hypothetical protein